MKCFGGKWRYVALLSLGKRQKTDKNSGGKRRCSKKKRGGSKSRSAGGGSEWRIGTGATTVVVGENCIFPGGEGCIFRQIAAHMLLRNNYKGRNIPLLTKEEKEEDCGGLGEHFFDGKMCAPPQRSSEFGVR